MQGMSKRIPKEETYRFYGDDARNVAIKALEDHITFITVSSKNVPRYGLRIDGCFVYKTNTIR